MKKFRITLGLLLSMIMLVGGTLTVFAANGEYTAPGSGQATVTANVTSSYIVRIPQTIVLAPSDTYDGYNMVGTYTISVTGDINSNERVNVVPGATFNLRDTTAASGTKEDVEAVVSQDCTAWTLNGDATYDEETTESLLVGTGTASGIIKANLSSGNWEGIETFTISVTAIN